MIIINIDNIGAKVRATPLTGLSVASGGVIIDTDTVLQAFGKLQHQITNIPQTNPGGSDRQLQFNNAGVFGGSPELTFFGTNRLSLGYPAPVDAGFRLDVNGNVRISGLITISQLGGNGSIINTNNGVWINFAAAGPQSASGATINVNTNYTGTNWAAFRYNGVINTATANPLRGVYITPTLTLANNWRSFECDNNIGYAFYAAGTAASYFGGNILLNTTTGSKIGGTGAKLALYNNTPIAQPTTAIAAATLVGGSGTNITDTDTFDGYTLGQVVKALRDLGALT